MDDRTLRAQTDRYVDDDLHDPYERALGGSPGERE